jgi:hypothetical protein
MAQEVIINVKANTKEAEASLQGVNSEIKNTQQVSGELSGSLDKMTGGAITKFNAFKGTLKGVIGGFKSLRVAIISTGIGALILAIGSLTAAFTASEEGQNKFRKILGVIGSVTGNLVDLLSDLGEGIISVFENPKEALLNFKNLLVENITNRFNSILETVGYVGKAIKLVFQGEFSQALDVGKKAASSLVDSFTGIPNTIDKASESVKGFAKEIADDASAAAKIADQRAEADKRTRDLIVERAKADRDRAELLEKAVNKEKFSTQERIQFLIEAGKLEDSITQKEIEAARLRFEAKQAENALSKSTKEDLDEEANLKAELIRLETAKLTKQKEVTSQVIALKNEEAAAEKAKQDEQDRLDKEAETKEQARLDSIQKIRDDFKLKQEDKEAQTNLQKAQLEESRKLAELDRLNATEEDKQAIRDYYAQVKLDAEDADTQASIELSNKEAEAKKQNLAAVGNALSSFASLVGEQTGAGKAAAIAATLISTYQSAQDSYKSLAGIPIIGPALGAAAAAVAVASGFKQIQAIKATKVPNDRGKSNVATPGASSVTAAAQAPSFNVVGGGATNQLAGLLAEETQKPVKAYVVSNEVTTAQSLDRNIVESATLG